LLSLVNRGKGKHRETDKKKENWKDERGNGAEPNQPEGRDKFYGKESYRCKENGVSGKEG